MGDPIHVVFFDESGRGPSEISIAVQNLDRMGISGDKCGLRVAAVHGGLVGHVTLGGFMLDRGAVERLQRDLEDWLLSHPAHGVTP